MIFVFLVFTIISVIVFYCVGKHRILAICLASILVGITFFNVFMLAYIKSNTNLLMYKGTVYWFKYKETVSVQELSISNFKLNVTYTTLTTPRNEISYKIKGTNNSKTISINDSDINSISVSPSNKAINHLTIKHNTYFSALTFMTTQKDEYVFSSK